MTGRRLLLVVVLFLAACPLTARTALAEPVSAIRWLAAGDSFASGEGLPEVEDERCQRATGRTGERAGPANIAWAPKALATLAEKDKRFSADRFSFVACTGNKSWNFSRSDGYTSAGEWLDQAKEAADPKNQLYEVRGSGTDRFDLVTFSFGGNDLGFASIIYDCIGLGANDLVESGLLGWLNPAAGVTNHLYRVGCDITDADIDRRLVAVQATLAKLYDFVASDVLTPGGRVVVLGYPQVIEEGERWALRYGTRCNRIKRSDTPLLRRAAARLNQTIGQAVTEANKRVGREAFTFIDVSKTFEATDDGNDRHGLCGAGEDWLNGLTAGVSGDIRWGFQRSFHPNQHAHDAKARLLVDHLSKPESLPQVPPPPSTTTTMKEVVLTDAQVLNSTAPAGVCGRGDDGWDQPRPIKLKNGSGEMRDAKGEATGPSINPAEIAGRGDFDGDGRKDVLVSVACSGGTIEQCCAGRSSHALYAYAVTAGPDGQPKVIGDVLRAGSSKPGNEYGPADRNIKSITVDARNRVVTREYIYYPEQYSRPQVGGADPYADVVVVRALRGGRWQSA